MNRCILDFHNVCQNTYFLFLWGNLDCWCMKYYYMTHLLNRSFVSHAPWKEEQRTDMQKCSHLEHVSHCCSNYICWNIHQRTTMFKKGICCNSTNKIY